MKCSTLASGMLSHLLIITTFACLPLLGGCNKAKTQANTALQPVDHSYSNYARLLASYVKGSRVDYAGLKQERTALDSAVAMVANADLSETSKLQRLAFYINAYNILTLRSIVDAYPVASIKDIDDVWKKEWRVAGAEVSINDIENKILRKEFDEPRIHMAINCASKSCPPLMPRPYLADSLDQQLEHSSMNFVTTNRYNELFPEENRAELSQVFNWFGEDFVEKYYDPERFQDLSEENNAVLNFVITHYPTPDQERLLVDSYDISFRDYDWSLNDIDR